MILKQLLIRGVVLIIIICLITGCSQVGVNSSGNSENTAIVPNSGLTTSSIEITASKAAQIVADECLGYYFLALDYDADRFAVRSYENFKEPHYYGFLGEYFVDKSTGKVFADHHTSTDNRLWEEPWKLVKSVKTQQPVFKANSLESANTQSSIDIANNIDESVPLSIKDFTIGQLKLNLTEDELINVLGKPIYKSTLDNFSYGLEYVYKDYVVCVYSDMVLGIVIKTQGPTTNRNISVGSSLDNMFKAYGEPYNTFSSSMKENFYMYEYLLGDKEGTFYDITFVTNENSDVISKIVIESGVF